MSWSKNKELAQPNAKEPNNKAIPKYPQNIKVISVLLLIHRVFNALNVKGRELSCECPNQMNVVIREGKLQYLRENVGLEIKGNKDKPQDGEKVDEEVKNKEDACP